MNQVVVHSPDLKPRDPTLVYDSNGNIIEESVSGTKLYYDSLGRLVRVADINDADIATYTYDATNKRVNKRAFGITTIYIYDLFGNLIGEYTTSGGLIKDYIYLGSKPIALISMPEGIRIGPIGCPSICTINVTPPPLPLKGGGEQFHGIQWIALHLAIILACAYSDIQQG